MASGPITSWQIGQTMEIVRDFILGGSKITANGDCCHEIKRHLLLGSKAMTNLDSKLNSRDKGPSGQSYGFSSSHIWMWELDSKESWSLKNWCFWAMVLKKTLESPLDCKEMKPVNPKGNQPWIFTGRTVAKTETPILWPPHAKSWLIGKDWCWEGLGAGGEGDDRGWDGWMASRTWWTWVWVNSGSWWWTGRPGVLQFMGSQRVGHDWATELNWAELIMSSYCLQSSRLSLFPCLILVICVLFLS